MTAITEDTEPLSQPPEIAAPHLRWHRRAEVGRHPIPAEKDPKLLENGMFSPQIGAVSDDLPRIFAAVMRGLLPHSWLEEDVWLSVASRACTGIEIADRVQAGCDRLRQILGRDILSVPAPVLTAGLRAFDGEPLFRDLLRIAVRYLYDDPRVWSGCGYEGVRGCRGDRQREGIADAAWLPEPQSEPQTEGAA